MAGYSYIVSLRIQHPTMSPEAFSTGLDILPERSWRRGEPRTTQGGRPLTGINRENFWTADLIDDSYQNKALSTAIDETVSRLSSRRDLLVEISESGGEASLVVGWFFPDGHSGDELGYALLAKLANLRLAISFYIYPEIATAASEPANDT